MRLDYGTQISPVPITLSIGVLRKPTLKEISLLSFEKFGYYEFLLTMNPETFYTKIKGDDGQDYWESLTEEEQNKITLFDIITKDEKLQNLYAEILNFFFVETVMFHKGFFILLKEPIQEIDEIDNPDIIAGAIYKELFPQVLEIIQQICCIYKDDEDEIIDDSKFKNALAKKLYEKMRKAKKAEKKVENKNLTIPNIISSLCSKHPSVNYTNIWEYTVFQLLDTFNRTQMNTMYEIDSTRVSVWGDEKKTFDATLWYRNEYDKNSQS